MPDPWAYRGQQAAFVAGASCRMSRRRLSFPRPARVGMAFPVSWVRYTLHAEAPQRLRMGRSHTGAGGARGREGVTVESRRGCENMAS